MTKNFCLLAALLWGLACTKGSLTGEGPSPEVPAAEPAKTPQLPDVAYNYAHIALPHHFSENVIVGLDQTSAKFTDNTPSDNPITDAGATLGRVLFYDKKLSSNGTIACASCHKQAYGFADPATVSRGVGGAVTRRNAMGLTNARFNRRGRFLWDERAATLEQQVLMPLQNPVEMGNSLPQLVDKIQAQPFYKPLFVNAFGSESVTADKVAKALAQFVRSMVSINSPYDVGRAKVADPLVDFPNFTPQENEGKKLFFNPVSKGGMACAECHATEAFINPAFGTTSNGLDTASTSDLGVFESNHLERFKGTFKMTSLKNIAVTAPYMHDGRFATLPAVVDFYDSGVQPHPNLGIVLKNNNGQPLRFHLTPAQKDAMVAFLQTLTDAELLNDPKFGDPFR